MSPETIFYLLIGIIIVDFIFERSLQYLNVKHTRIDLPDGLKGIYDEEKYNKFIRYQTINEKFSIITSIFSFIVILVVLFMNGFAILDEWLRQYTENNYWLTALFFGIIFIVNDMISIPFELYDTFVIEQKFGFNKTTPKIYITDKLKGYLLAIVIGGGLLFLFLFFYYQSGNNFWVYAWVVFTLFSLIMNLFFTSWILPLFNKLIPLENNSLKESILRYSQKINFPVENILIMDGSKRSSKANAFFSGFGKKKKIVLFDTLIKNHTENELVAILAHEAGHYKKKHIQKSMIFSVLYSGLVLFLLSYIIDKPELSLALGSSKPSIYLGLIVFGILYSPISFVIGIMTNYFSRKNEFEADRFAKDTFNGKDLQTALKKLSVNNLSNLFPHPWLVFFNYSHPTLLQRLNSLDNNI